MSLADDVERMRWAFRRDDNRHGDVSKVAARVRKLEADFAEAMEVLRHERRLFHQACGDADCTIDRFLARIDATASGGGGETRPGETILTGYYRGAKQRPAGKGTR